MNVQLDGFPENRPIYTTDSADPFWTKQEQFLGF